MGEEQGPRRKEAGPDDALQASMQRVKVYRLTDDGKWDDQGTGHVTIDYIEGSRKIALTVVDEEDSDTLLIHHITSDDIYRKQEETIISWRDPEKALELALSFQEAAGCSYIWESVCTIQRNLQFNVLDVQEASPPAAFESLEASRNQPFHDESLSSTNREFKRLPPLDLSSLSSILKTILECSMTERMRVSVAELILQYHDFFPQLVNLLRTCESSGNMDALHMIFRLVKGIIFLNSSAIFDKIFSDDFILEIIGALEYDPEARSVQNHRYFLKEHAIFKEAIPIKSASVVSKIHQTYRIGYIKDVILPRVVDDATMASIAAIIHANNAAVVCLLKDDSSFVKELFTKMRSSNISAESKRELVLFLLEFCTLSKSLQPVQQLQLSRDLASEGVFDIMSDVLQSQDKVLISAGTGILVHFLNQDPNLLRSYIARQENSQEGNSLLGFLVQGMVTDFSESLHCQFLEILKILMDGFAANTPTHHRGVIDVFHEKHLDKLIDVIASSQMDITQSTSSPVGVGTRVEDKSAKTEILSNICELLFFCVVHHPYKIKVNFLRSNSMEKILTLTCRREKILVVAAVRFMRTVISRNDELLLNHIIKFNLLKPIIEVFVENGDRYNMLHSGVLELLEYIRKENLKSLVIYVTEYFWNQLARFEKLGNIQAFRLKYQQLMENGETTQSIVIGMRKKTEERGLDKEEEDYFNKGSDEEDSAKQSARAQEQPLDKSAKGSDIHQLPARSKSGGLVDYDDDDKGYNPPPKRTVRADEDDEALIIKRSPVVDKQADGKSPKKPKLEPRFICSKIVAAARSDLADKQGSLSPASSMKSNGDIGEEEPRHASGSLDRTHEKGDDCTKDAGNLPSEMTVNKTKATDSEPYSVR
ncbi:serine/threonine-protein phosphatase 4 regulatory subunit 3B-like isoform X2 [Oryza brachyantha]|uniref:serine/threonine-protein phosphatase 4 regulatory subunit 3B-like isoform X2 n=1 Tax=Oryza brachyantha TaxID=4533 RepID=UPI0007761777|nr:serine/threonine-protein phosphatase 4 regulatory subunit 3B-like isoform X2 [Oryza brachyantha]